MRPLLLLLAACTKGEPAPDSEPLVIEPFCTSYAEADTQRIDEGDGGASGQVLGQLLTAVSEDPFDPNYVGFVEVLIDNLDVGGAPTLSQTDGEGRFTVSLGPGRWQVKTSVQEGGYLCQSAYAFDVLAGRLTRVCVDMRCALP